MKWETYRCMCPRCRRADVMRAVYNVAGVVVLLALAWCALVLLGLMREAGVQ